MYCPQYLVPFSLMLWPLSRLLVARGRQSPKYNIYTILFAIGPRLLQTPGTAMNVAYGLCCLLICLCCLLCSVLKRGYLMPKRGGVSVSDTKSAYRMRALGPFIDLVYGTMDITNSFSFWLFVV